MKVFDYLSAPQKLLTPEIVGLLTAIHECRGRQGVLSLTRPDVLDSLKEVAKIQSTGASNRIEGIGTTDKRLREIVAEKVEPRNRNEREIAGYREALSLIHESHEHIKLSPNVILQLHRMLYSFSGKGFGGAWKNSDNAISETGADGKQVVRFHPVSAFQTPDAMERLCSAFSEAWDGGVCDKLILAHLFVFDFLCVHPFNDGNGRMSRLLSLLLFYQAGHEIGKYISVEKVIEESKETYYEVLQECSQGWHENQNGYVPFVRYGLGVLLKVYRTLDNRIAHLAGRTTSKPQQIKTWLDNQLGAFSKQDILNAFPEISQTTVERTLSVLLKSGKITKRGAGPATEYVRASGM